MKTMITCPVCHGDGKLITNTGKETPCWSCMGFCEIEDTNDENWEPTEVQQGLIPIPDGYAEE